MAVSVIHDALYRKDKMEINKWYCGRIMQASNGYAWKANKQGRTGIYPLRDGAFSWISTENLQIRVLKNDASNKLETIQLIRWSKGHLSVSGAFRP